MMSEQEWRSGLSGDSKCSHCDDSGLVYQYDKDGGVVNMPCPECTEDAMSHIRNWDWKGQMFDG